MKQCILLPLMLMTGVLWMPREAEASSRRDTPLVKAIETAKTAVVNIHTEKTATEADALFGTSSAKKITGMGAGIVVDPRGYVATNYHVVADVDVLDVSLADGSRYAAKVLSFDRKHDLALIKIEPQRTLETMKLGVSADLMLGETVIAVGNPFGYVHTITSGIVSAMHRDVDVNETQSYANLIQTDASINPGNSGGPLLNLDGEVIGINVAIRAGAQRIGFAIPIDDAREVIAELISIELLNGVSHGLETEDVKTEDIRELRVSRIRQTSVRSDASVVETADLSSGTPEPINILPGDVIVSVDRVPVADRADFERLLLDHDRTVDPQVTVRRDGRELEVALKISPLPIRSGLSAISAGGVERAVSASPVVGTVDEKVWDRLGVKLDAAPVDSRATADRRQRSGMVIAEVRPGSPAAKNGLKAGDVLIGLHVWQTVTMKDVEFVVDHPQLTSFSPLKFYILRQGETLFGHLKLAAR